jgi:hypothetical protein
MVQASDSTNTTRVSFASAGATRSMVAQPKPAVSVLRRMNQLPPRNFNAFIQPDADELQDRADILQCHIRREATVLMRPDR